MNPSRTSAFTSLATRPSPLTALVWPIAMAVLLMHGAALWALHAGLLARVTDTIVPVLLLSMGAPPQPPTTSGPHPAPSAAPKARPAPPRPDLQTPPAAPAHTPIAAPATTIVPPQGNTPAPLAAPAAADTPSPADRGSPQATGPSASGGPVPARTPPASERPPPALELPSSDADYLNNPKPIYPRLSKQLREEGRVLVRVHISAEGLPEKIELAQTSGHFRLDQAALDAVAQWRFVPGKRQGVPQAMWYQVPIPFVLR